MLNYLVWELSNLMKPKRMMMNKLLLLLLITFHPLSFADSYDGTLDVFESSPDLKPYFDN